MCNGLLQGVYLMYVVRVFGFDIGVMLGFNFILLNEIFFVDSIWKVNFLLNIGYGDGKKVYKCLLCLLFDEVCQVF